MAEPRHLLQESLIAIERLEARLAASEHAKHEPLAIVGASCRYPGGVENPDDLWRVLRDGVDAVSEVPADRWDADAFYDPDPKAPGKMVTKRGGFLKQVDKFDPQFFGISPREAATMDPQQRLLLEASSDALESAGIAVDKLVGSLTGVFVGITTTDFALVLREGGLGNADIYSGTGAALNAAAGRIAFTFGFQGPCASIDTACSSSLVAVHLACQSLRAGESDLALAGGVNVILSPDAMVLISKWGMLAPDGRCKTFSAAADGFVRSEGVAMLALKRLSDARAAGDPILALIRGSAFNSDGRSSGLTVPNGPAQQAVLRTALKSAELNPSDIDYVEAHGTGTALGDPIEVEALGAVMRQGRAAERPLMIGSIKTNIGHAEAASGVAGLMKVVMSLRNEAIPPHLHFDAPNPRIPWADLPVTVPTKLTPWKRSERPRRAGVSGFGFSGTNAHIILEEAPADAPPRPVAAGTSFLVPLSARDDAGLRAVAGRYADFIASGTGATIADIASTAATGRSHHTRRIAVVTDSAKDLETDLRAIAAGQTPPTAAEGTTRTGERPKIAFLFTGQGSQYAGMGRGLYDSEPVFKAALDRCAALLKPHLAKPLLDVMFPADEAGQRLVSETGYTQPALFAIEFALTELWASWGITPSIVMGHSVGEYVAACVAGAYSLEDGLALIAERGRLMQALPAGGGMAAIMADEAKVTARIANMTSKLSIAAVNGPEETVVSGDADALAELVKAYTADGIKAKALDVSHAFHSHRLDPMLDALEQRANKIDHKSPRIPLVSNLTGAPWQAGARPDGEYWRRHAREPVRFAAGVEALKAAGVTALLEVGPQATLLALAGRAAPGAKWSSTASLRKGRADRREMLSALGALYTRGASVKWEAIASGQRVSLPTYPYQRERHWIESMKAGRTVVTTGGHPLLGQRQRSPQPGAQFLAEISREAPAFVADHVVLGTVLVPGTGYIEMGLAAARALGAEGPVAIQNFVIESPLALEANKTRLVHVSIEPDNGGRAAFAVQSTAREAPSDTPWAVHARGWIKKSGLTAGDDSVPTVAQVRERCPTNVPVDAFYTRLEAIGLEYGPAFRLVRSLSVGKHEAVGLLDNPSTPDAAAGEGYVLHPALLDATFHLLGAALLAAQPEGAADQVFLPIGIEEIRLTGTVPARVWATARVRDASPGAAVLVADLRLEDEAGTLVANVSGLQLRTVTADTLRRALALPGIATHSYQVRWQQVEAPAAAADARSEGRYVLIDDRGGVAAALGKALEEQGASCTFVSAADSATMGDDKLTAFFKGDGKVPLAWVIDCASVDGVTGIPTANARSGYLRLLSIAKALAATSPRAGLCLVTRGAQTIAPGDEVDLGRSALLGLARTAAAERSDAPALRIDLDPAAPPDVRVILRALGSLTESEPEVGIRNGNIFAPRLEESAHTTPRATTDRKVLRIRNRGALDALTVETEPLRAPAAGEVQISIRAAGLNFRDVLNTLGMYPGDAGALGSECSGVITAVGSGVTHLAVGDDVVALAGDSIASHVTVSANLTVKKPSRLGFADAVTLPNTYLTAAQSLRTGGLKKGQRILVHAATGGVGLAALRLAKRMGAEVIATAGSPEKRAFCIAEGASHAFDSRSASFEGEVMRVTDGAGVDMVLNSLSNELIFAGMRVLKKGGCFLEIGKKDIWTPEEAKTRAPNIRYEVVDLGQAILEDASAVRALFEELLRDVAAGELASLPLRAFPLDSAVTAFRYMATARHIGKIVIVPSPEPATALRIRDDATYLITGGLGGLGFATAEWLAKRGAREIVLVGRHGPTAAHEAKISELRKSGCRVTALACDIGDRDAVRKLSTEVLASRPQLYGIVHTAGVLADAPLAQQDADRFQVTASSKIDGGWNLHEQFAHLPLDFFAFYSSSSALFGSPGQANYAASNAFLDGLAAYRRAHGQCGTSIAWGAWADVGMAAKLSEAHRSRWAQLGMGALDPDDALLAFERALLGSDPHIAIAAIDPGRIASQASTAVRALLGAAAATKREAPVAATADALAALRAASGADPAERLALLRPYVHNEAARVLGFNASALDAETPLAALGFDSLMAVQLKNRVESDLAVEIPLAQFLTSPTVAKLIEGIAARLGSGAGAAPAPTTAAAAGAWEEGSL